MVDLILLCECLELVFICIIVVQCEVLEVVVECVCSYYEKQKQGFWCYIEVDGMVFGQQVILLDCVGFYVLGGKVFYLFLVLMNVILVKVVGVFEVVMVVLILCGEINEIVFVVVCIVGVDCVFIIGGVQVVVVLVYGIESVLWVDKIVGFGNIYVVIVKCYVFGQVGIDMIVGFLEIFVVCDGQIDFDWIVMDLFFQVEYDEDVQLILVSLDVVFLDCVVDSIVCLLLIMECVEIICIFLEGCGVLIQVVDQVQVCVVVNCIVLEYLELLVVDLESWLLEICYVGVIFMGCYIVEVLGDYCVGLNYVLLIFGIVCFFLLLGVYDFQKCLLIINCLVEGVLVFGCIVLVLVCGELLIVYVCSVEYCIFDEKEV